jgi:nucleoside-diphosphate-sugar epimerase
VAEARSTEVPGRVFITGALGLIGGRLAERYREAGATVTGMDVRAEPALGVVAGDLTAPGPWQQAMNGADLVIHTAARVGMRGDEESFWRPNVLGTRNALDATVAAGAKRFVHFSSIVVFGFDYRETVDEQTPTRPNRVPYVDTKVASEQAVLQAHAAGDIPCTVIRPGDVYGPRSHPWTITPVREIAARRLVLPAMGRGLLSPVYVDDLVDGVMLASARPEAEGEVLILTGDRSVTTREFFGHYARMLGKKRVPVAPTAAVVALATAVAAASRVTGAESEVTPAAVRYVARATTYSIEKARSLLDYEPKVDLDEGMRRSEQWLREAGLLDRRV